MRHVISIHDVVSDTMHQFAPSYHDYVLYSNGGTKEAPKKVRTSLVQCVRNTPLNNFWGRPAMHILLFSFQTQHIKWFRGWHASWVR